MVAQAHLKSSSLSAEPGVNMSSNRSGESLDLRRGEVLQCVDPLKDPSWDKTIGSDAGVSFFHTAGWARVLHETYRYTPRYLVLQLDGLPRSVLPLMEVDSWLTGRRGVTLPFTDECHALGASTETSSRLFRHVLEQAKTRRWKYYELRGSRSIAGDAPASVSFYGHTVQLEADPTKLFTKISGAARTAVRKAEQGGLTVEFSQSLEAARSFHALLCQTRVKHGAPPQPIGFFESIQRHIMAGGRGSIVLAKLNEKPVAGAVFFHFGKSAMYKYAASDMAFKHLQGNNLVLWRAMEHYGRAGFSDMDFGRTSLGNSGLRRFKLAWGPAERTIDYVKYECKTKAFVTSIDRASGWQTLVFKTMPAGMTRILGSLIYRHFA